MKVSLCLNENFSVWEEINQPSCVKKDMGDLKIMCKDKSSIETLLLLFYDSDKKLAWFQLPVCPLPDDSWKKNQSNFNFKKYQNTTSQPASLLNIKIKKRKKALGLLARINVDNGVQQSAPLIRMGSFSPFAFEKFIMLSIFLILKFCLKRVFLEQNKNRMLTFKSSSDI